MISFPKKWFDVEDRDAALREAATSGSLSAMIEALDLGAHVETRGIMEKTPLHLAAESSAECTLELLRRGAIVDSRDKFERTPLIIAVLTGREDCSKALIDARADISAMDEKDFDALTHAAKSAKHDIMRLIVSSGGALRKETTRINPLLWTIYNLDVSGVEMLLRAGLGPRTSLEGQRVKQQLEGTNQAFKRRCAEIEYLIKEEKALSAEASDPRRQSVRRRI